MNNRSRWKDGLSMIKPLEYSTDTVVMFSLENFHNAGLTPEKTKECIERITGSYTATRVGVNHNWQIQLYGRELYGVVSDIECELNKECRK